MLSAYQSALDPSTWAFRQRIWGTALRMIGGFPFTGTGMGSFDDVADIPCGLRFPRNPQAHNLFLQITLDLALPGLVALLAVLSLILWAAVRAYRLLGRLQEYSLQAVAIGALSGTIATATHGLVDSHTWGSKAAFLSWMVMELVVALHGWAFARRRQLGQPNEEQLPSTRTI